MVVGGAQSFITGGGATELVYSMGWWWMVDGRMGISGLARRCLSLASLYYFLASGASFCVVSVLDLLWSLGEEY